MCSQAGRIGCNCNVMYVVESYCESVVQQCATAVPWSRRSAEAQNATDKSCPLSPSPPPAEAGLKPSWQNYQRLAIGC